MTTRRLGTFAFAAMIACAGCAARMAAEPLAVTQPATSRSPGATPPSKPAASIPPATAGRAGGAPAAAPEAVPDTPPAAAKKAAPSAGPAPTDSIYVFSAQQVVSAPASRLAQASAALDSANPAPDSTTKPSASAAGQDAPPDSDPRSAPPSQALPPTRGELQLQVVGSAPEIAVGDVIDVDVIASSDADVLDAPLRLSFDPHVMTYVDGAPGDFLTQGGSSLVFLSDGLSRPGDVAIAVGRVNRAQGARGAGLLCRVHLRGLAAGTTQVMVGEAMAWDANGDEMTVHTGGMTAVVR